MKVFGKDGIRGVYGKELTTELSFQLGRVAARLFGKGTVLLAQDSRVSGESLVNALANGINTERSAPHFLGILPVPALAYFTKQLGACCGIMVSASRYGPEYNGIKVFNSEGQKLNAEEEEEFERIFVDLPDREGIPTKPAKVLDVYGTYIDYIASFCSSPLSGLVVRLDCSYGACTGIAPSVFSKLGARVYAYNDTHMGNKINVGCGTMHPEFLLSKMGRERNEIGFVFDGDGDSLRVLAGGQVLDGDTVLYILCQHLPLANNTVVGTLVNNLALERALAQKGIRMVRGCVGNKFITRVIHERNYSLGGENNGHYCIRGSVATCDALLAAVVLSDALYKKGKLQHIPSLSLFPQKTLTYPAPRSLIQHPAFKNLSEDAERQLGADGRVLIRMSGTGSRIRVMLEHRSAAMVERWHKRFAVLIKQLSQELESAATKDVLLTVGVN